MALGGTVLGIIMGAFLGIGSTITMALLLPFTFWMKPAGALILLGFVYCDATYGSSISGTTRYTFSIAYLEDGIQLLPAVVGLFAVSGVFVMKKSTKVRQMLQKKEALVVPGVHDVLSAKLVQKAGFKAVQASGLGLAATLLGLPDMAFLSFGEMCDFTRTIANSIDVPLMADADTGFGNSINAMYVTRKYIEAGCAGMNIEDQMFPKRCGHMEGKTIVTMEEMALKIKACTKARNEMDLDFIINARTDSIAVSGIDEAIRRGNAYIDAGADMIFVEAPRTVEDIKRAVKVIHGLVSINLFDFVQGGKTPLISVDELKAIGVARISVPVGPLFAAVKGMANYLNVIKDGFAPGRTDLVSSFAEYKELIGYNKFRDLEKEYLPKFVE